MENGSRRYFVERTIEQKEFRSRDRDVVPGQLPITLRDLIGIEYHKYVPSFDDPAVERVLDEAITIDHSTMTKWLNDAEQTAIRKKQGRASKGNYGANNPDDDDDKDSIDSSSDGQSYTIIEYDPKLDGGDNSSSSSDSSHYAHESTGSEFEASSPNDPSDSSTDRKASSRESGRQEALNSAASRSRSSRLSESPDPLSTDSEKHRINDAAASARKRTQSRSTSTSTMSTDTVSKNPPAHLTLPYSKRKHYKK